MKKTTLISTLAMVVIVALALTTATFAWYTSNSSVTATSSATAAVASSANLAIGADASATGISHPITGGTEMSPAAPTSNWLTDTTKPTYTTATKTDTSAILQTAIATQDGKASEDAKAAAFMSGTFYLINRSSGDSAAITPKVTLTATTKTVETGDAPADGSGLLRVAIFVGGEYKTTLAPTTATDKKVTFGAITKGQDMPKATATGWTWTATDTFTFEELAGGTNIQIGIVAWFDGTLLNDATQGVACDFTLAFTDSTAS